ncbi:MAG: hypothetical protein ABIZ52_03915 [Candidatus Limnocylindrales bacterium]
MRGRRRFMSALASATVLAMVAAACGGPVPAGTAGPASSGAIGIGAPTAASTAPPTNAGSPGIALAGRTVHGGPIDVSVVLDAGAKAEKVIPVEGGTLSAIGADGTIYSLMFPADALLVETTISLTPVASADGLPFGGTRTYAVQLGPDGLSLNNYAVLTITPPSPIAVDRQVMFGYLRDGKDVILAQPVMDSSEIKMNILHFSGNGVTDASIATDRELLGAYAERQLSDAISETMAFERQHQLLCETCPPTVDSIAYTAAVMDAYYEQVVKPRVDAAGDSCEAGKLAVQTVLGVQRQNELLGILDRPTYPGLYDKVARLCVIEEFEACVEHHRIFLMLPLYLGMARQQELGHFYTEGTMAEARDLTTKCVTFRLEFKSTAKSTGALTYSSSVTSSIRLQFNPGTELTGGHAEYINTAFSMTVPNCSVTTTPGGSIFAVFGLLWDVDPGQPDSNGGYPDAQVGDFTLAYMPDNSTETAILKCPDAGPLPMTYPAWSIAYLGVHLSDVTRTGLVDTSWKIKGGELFATKEWSLAKGTFEEEGSFELYHVPGQ